MTYGYYPPGGLNLSKNHCVSCVTIDLTTNPTLYHCHKPRQLMSTVGLNVKIQIIEINGCNQELHQDMSGGGHD
jgi:hypothetical protein